MKKETWFDVLCYAVGEQDLGKLSAAQVKALDSDMIGCLMQIWARCSQDDFYESRVKLTVPAGESCIELSTIEELEGESVNYFTRIVYRTTPTDPWDDTECVLVCEQDMICQEELECPGDHDKGACPVLPDAYELKDGKLYFNRPFCAETELVICYQRYPKCEIKAVGADGILEYQCPDIPLEMLFVLKDHVRARFFSSNLDWANASAQFQLADRGFDNIKEAMAVDSKDEQTMVSHVSCLTGPTDTCMCRDICTCALKHRGPVEQIRPECWLGGPQDAEIQLTHEWSTRSQVM